MLKYYSKLIKRDEAVANPKILFVFEDNVGRYGHSRQANELYNLANAVGFPVMWNMNEPLQDEDIKAIRLVTRKGIEQLTTHRGDILWPVSGIGEALISNAPKIAKFYGLLCDRIR